MTKSYMREAMEKFFSDGIEAALPTVLEGANYYGNQLQKIISGSPVIDGVLIAAAMKSILGAIEETFDQEDKRIVDIIMANTMVLRMDVPGEEASEDDR